MTHADLLALNRLTATQIRRHLRLDPLAFFLLACNFAINLAAFSLTPSLSWRALFALLALWGASLLARSLSLHRRLRRALASLDADYHDLLALAPWESRIPSYPPPFKPPK